MSARGSYVDLHNTHSIDERIKNSFNQTTNMLTNTFPNPTSDLRQNRTTAGIPLYPVDDHSQPHMFLNNKSSLDYRNDKKQSFKDKVEEERPLSRSTTAGKQRALSTNEIHGEQSRGNTIDGLANPILSVENVSAHEYQYDTPYKYFSNHIKELLNEKRILNLNHLNDIDKEKPHLTRSLSARLYPHGYGNGDYLSRYLPDYVDLSRTPQDEKTLTIAEEYQKFQREINMQNEYNRVYSRYANDHPWHNRPVSYDRPQLLTRDSVRSVRLNSQGNSLDRYPAASKNIDNDLPLSEPTRSSQPYNSRYSAYRGNHYLEARGIKDLYRDRLFDNGLYSDYLEYQKPPVQKQDKEDIYLEESTEVKEIEEKSKENNTEAKHDLKTTPEKTKNNPNKQSYGDIAAKQKEIKKKNKTVKRRAQKDNKEPASDSSKEEDIFHCQCSDEEPEAEMDTKTSGDYVETKPGYYYSSQNPYSQRPLYMSQTYTNPYKLTPTAPSMEAHETKSPHSDGEYQPSYNIYDDSPITRQYFSDAQQNKNTPQQNSLPPINLESHQSSANAEPINKIDPLAFKLVNTDSDMYLVKRNKMIRQKEYAELLRQHQKEMLKEKPQAAQKPFTRQYNPDHGDLVDAIEVMKQRHEEEKRAIEQMRQQIQSRMSQKCF